MQFLSATNNFTRALSLIASFSTGLLMTSDAFAVLMP
jgi:hypothetical protein